MQLTTSYIYLKYHETLNFLLLLFLETFIRFDGIVVGIPDEKKYQGYLWGFKNDKYEEDLDLDIVFALKYFFPKWKGFILGNDMSCHTCKEALDCIESIHKGFWTNFGERFRKWKQDYMKYKQHVGVVGK